MRSACPASPVGPSSPTLDCASRRRMRRRSHPRCRSWLTDVEDVVRHAIHLGKDEGGIGEVARVNVLVRQLELVTHIQEDTENRLPSRPKELELLTAQCALSELLAPHLAAVQEAPPCETRAVGV